MRSVSILVLASLTLVGCDGNTPTGEPPLDDPTTTGASVTITTTGLDLDPDGYRLVVDGLDLAAIAVVTTRFVGLEPGTRTVALTDVAPNCAVQGPQSHTLTIAAQEVAPIEFAVVCTATTGVITVSVLQKGLGAEYRATVDGATPLILTPGVRAYLANVRAGLHPVSLEAPPVCSVEGGSQEVTVTGGTLIRDTAEVIFSASCQTAFQVFVRTTGRIPDEDYSVWVCRVIMDCWGVPPDSLGAVAPNSSVFVPVDPGFYWLYLMDLPSNCFVRWSITGVNPKRDLRISEGDVLSVGFLVHCN